MVVLYIFYSNVFNNFRNNFVLLLLGAMNERKRVIQERVFKEFSVHVDQVLQGTGTTNTGNVARRCLQDPNKFARCLEINEDIVEKVAFILLAFKQKTMVDQDILKALGESTCKKIYLVYPWVSISPTLHKLLIHGTTIQSRFKLPLGFYAEDAGESCHKLYRANATHHARQTSRKNRLKDIYNYAIYYSDPAISNIYVQKRAKFHHTPALPSKFLEIFNLQ